MTLTDLLLRGVKSQFNADANRKTVDLPVNMVLPFTHCPPAFFSREMQCQIQLDDTVLTVTDIFLISTARLDGFNLLSLQDTDSSLK